MCNSKKPPRLFKKHLKDLEKLIFWYAITPCYFFNPTEKWIFAENFPNIFIFSFFKFSWYPDMSWASIELSGATHFFLFLSVII